ARVEALLAAIDQAGSFLETPAMARESSRTPAAGPVSPTLADEALSRGAPAGIETTAGLDVLGTSTARPGSRHGDAGRSEFSTPARLGECELVRRLGEGSMGVVYEARQVSLNRPVAVKMVRAGLLAREADPRRFRIEAEAVAHLDHPRIVP